MTNDSRHRPKILMATLFDWESPLHLGSHNLARAFARMGWNVAFVSTAISPMLLMRDARTVPAKSAWRIREGAFMPMDDSGRFRRSLC